MGAALQHDDARLTQADVEAITGIEGEHPVAQRNRLRKLGIKAEVNARREVVCFWSWVAAAALPEEAEGRYIPKSANDDKVPTSEELGLRLGRNRG